MKNDPILTNILSIAGAGLLILLTGILFLVFRDFISRNYRFFLPIPPIGVAAYIYVFNLFQHNDGQLSDRLSNLAREVLLSTGTITLAFGIFVILLITFINVTRRFF